MAEVRQLIDVASLETYLQKHVPAIQVPLEIKQFGYGQSNPTYLLIDRSKKKFVMRKKPPGKLLSKTAHKVEREYRIIHALEQTDVPVPKTYCLCEDSSVIGTPFYVMGFLDGRIFEDAHIPEVSPAERTAMWHDAVLTLVKLHRIKPASVGLSAYGKPTGFYNRQIATWQTLEESQAATADVESGKLVSRVPRTTQMLEFFKDPSLQPRDRSSLMHGDYKIDNLVFHKTEPKVIGILDWEMSTVGHPLADLIILTQPWTVTANSSGPRRNSHPAFQPGSSYPGLPSKAQCIAWYRDAAGWNPEPDILWGDAFSLFRTSIVMQGIAARYAVRQASGEGAYEVGQEMFPFAEMAWKLVGETRRIKDKDGGRTKL